MEAALVSASINLLLPRLFSVLGEKYKLHESVTRNIKFLKDELEMITGAIDDQTRNGVVLSSTRTQWTQKLRQLAYEIEDCIDLYVYRHTHKKRAAKVRRATTMIGKDLEFAAKIGELRGKVNELYERLQRYTKWSSKPEPPAAPAYDPYTSKAELVGIKKAQKDILDLLEEGVGELEQRKVITIVGFDGLGKTVLAEQVFQSDVVAAKEFSPRARIVAAEKEAKEVLLSIRSELHLDELQLHGNVDDVKLLSSDLEQHLHDKRYLIVIDDMRTDLWSTIGSAFPTNKGLNCRVIVTTPSQSIASACSFPDHRYVYKMRELGAEHSAELFDSRGPKMELDKTHILKKCDGLPLALVSIAQFMSKKCWDGVTTSCKDLCDMLGYYLETDKDTLARMQQVLTKAYTSLDGHGHKACLLYLGMFPSECPIRRKRLIRRWLAEGFVETHSMAEKAFKELMDLNITRPVGLGHNRDVKTCRTCGMMLEFIMRKSISQDFITMFSNGAAKLFCDQEGPPTHARRLCLHRMSKSKVNLGDVSLVRSVATFGDVLDQNLMQLKESQLLRVLDLEDCTDLNERVLQSICNRLLLKYLSLGETITLIPREITNLGFLQTLNVTRKNVTALPIEVVLLPFLIHLLGKFRFIGNDKQKIRAETFLMSGESKLQTLAGFIVDKSQGFAELMIHMNNLKKIKAWCYSTSGNNGILHLEKAVQKFIEDVRGEDQAKQIDRSLSLHFDQSLSDRKDKVSRPIMGCKSGAVKEPALLARGFYSKGTKMTRRSLDEDGVSGSKIITAFNFASDFLHSLEGSRCYLSSLKLHGYTGAELPRFVSWLHGLKELQLSTSNLTANIMSTMSELRYLQYLNLVADKLEVSVIEAGGFPELLRLCLQLHGPTNSNVLEEIKEGAFPKLVALKLLFKGLNGPSGINIAHLNSLMEVTLHPDQTAELDNWQKAVKGHSNRPRIELLATADLKEIIVMENSTTRGKTTPDIIVTQKPHPVHSIPPASRLIKALEDNGVLNCSQKIEKMSLERDCSVTSADPGNVVSGANLTEIHMDPNMTEEYEHGKAFLPDYALIKSPWQMKKFHEWYMEASNKGLEEIIVHVPAEVYYSEEPSTIVVDFSDMHRMFCLQMLDVNLISVWCLMQYCHAQQLGIEIGFLNPLLIAQPEHAFKVANGHLYPEKHEQRRNKTAAYIGRVMFEMQNKDCIYAAYTFNHHFVCIMLYPKLGEMVVLDSLDYDSSTYKEFINIIQNGYKLYVRQGGIHNNKARENMIIHTLQCHKQPPGSVLCGYYVCEFLRISGVYRKNNPDDLLKILLNNRHLTDEDISKICSDMCFFILNEICHTYGQFFSKDSDLATKEKYRFLREWNMTEM